MDTYQVSIVFISNDPASATDFAKRLQEKAVLLLGDSGVGLDGAKIAFTKFEKEEDAQQ